jgi:secretion/DNA translocation related TadE-like protein
VTPRDRGSASLWLVAACLLLFLVGSVGTLRATAVLARHRAETAADLAALAAATRLGTGADACAAARTVVWANGARLDTCRVTLAPRGRGGTVDVRATVSVRLPVVGARHATATARAGRLPAATSAG